MFPGLGKAVRDCAGISARDPSRDLLRLLARVVVICSYPSHAPGPRFETVCLRAPHLERLRATRIGAKFMRSPGKRRIRPHSRDLRPRQPPHPESSA